VQRRPGGPRRGSFETCEQFLKENPSPCADAPPIELHAAAEVECQRDGRSERECDEILRAMSDARRGTHDRAVDLAAGLVRGAEIGHDVADGREIAIS